MEYKDIVRKFVVKILLMYLIFAVGVGTYVILQIINGDFYEINCNQKS